jgi:predicted TPR repeat methyltransferase
MIKHGSRVRSVNRKDLQRMIEQIPESDLGLAYQFLRRLTGRPSIPVAVPLQVEELNDHNDDEFDSELEEAFDYVVKEYDETLKRLVNR